MTPSCYAQRLLNPFRGVMNIVEYQGAEAVTIDGCHWDLYVRDTTLVADLANSHKVQTSDIRYGSWSLKQGLKRGALYPSDDFKQLELLGALVYEYLLDHHSRVPFPLRDHYELWLLDDRDRPLALLNSVIHEEDIELDGPLDWRAGHECCRHFNTATTAALDCTKAGSSAGEYLTRLVNSRAGPTPHAQWFLRSTDGSGRGLQGINIPAELTARQLSAQAFPEFFLGACDDSTEHQQLLEAFLAWQAPCLLLLTHLTDRQRSHYEQYAIQRALAVDRHYRLYPKIIDEEAIRAARVEALLRAGEATVDSEDDILATYYIELNVTRTN